MSDEHLRMGTAMHNAMVAGAEIGMDTDGEGGVQPVPAIYPKIEREVHLALMALLSAAAA